MCDGNFGTLEKVAISIPIGTCALPTAIPVCGMGKGNRTSLVQIPHGKGKMWGMRQRNVTFRENAASVV